VRNPISTDSVAASERLKKSRKKQQQDAEAVEKIQEQAIEREEANARREAEIEQSKAGAVSYEEWLAKD
jgi:hypothetical protein